MNTKTTKFLAVLAVLAVAFAGSAVLLSEQQDAVPAEGVTKATYTTAGQNSGYKSIALEETADPQSVVLYTSATVIKAKNAYFFAEDASVILPKTITLNAAVMFFVLDGVTLNIIAPTDDDITGTFGLVEFVNVKDYDSTNGIITLDAARLPEAGLVPSTLFNANGYAYANGSGIPTFAYAASDVNITYEKKDSFAITADKDVAKKFTFSTVKNFDVYNDVSISGEIKTVTVKATSVSLTLDSFTGTITDGTNSIAVSNFTGKIDESDAIAAESLVVKKWTAGQIISATNLKLAEVISLGMGDSIYFAEGLQIPAGVYFDYMTALNDEHYLILDKPVTVGLGGATISAGINSISIYGVMTLTANTVFNFAGVGEIGGQIYTKNGATTYSLTILNWQNDVRVTSNLQIIDGGQLLVRAPLFVMSGGSLYVAGSLFVMDYDGTNDVPAGILKVAPKGYVNIQGNLNLYTNSPVTKAKVWDAGKIYMSAVLLNDTALTPLTLNLANGTFYRVFMNSEDGRGVAVIDSVERDLGSEAYGMYLSVFGKSTVNIVGASSVMASVYGLETMTIAESDNNFGAIVVTDNQYPAIIEFDRKPYTGGQDGPKTALYTVDWNTSSNGILTVYVKETFDVTITNAYAVGGQTTTQNVKVFDSAGKEIVMTSDNATATTGKVKLVYGEDYTIVGQVDENKYTYASEDVEIDKSSMTTGNFTMIRGAATIDVTIGVPKEITVTVSNPEYLTVGEEFLFYKIGVEGELESVAYSSTAMKVTFYTGDAMYFMSEDKQFYKFSLTYIGDAVDLSSSDWTAEAQIVNAETATILVTDVPAVVPETFTIKAVDKTGADIAVPSGAGMTVTWDVKSPMGETPNPYTFNVTKQFNMYTGEEFIVEWADVDGYSAAVIYSTDVDYVAGTLMVEASAAYNFVLTYTKLVYADVKNSTEQDLTVTYGDSEPFVAAESTEEDSIVVNEAQYISLLAKGKTIVSWTYTVDGDEVEQVIGAKTEKSVAIEAEGELEILTVNAVDNTYHVIVDPIYHDIITYYDQAGKYLYDMVIYLQPDTGEHVKGVTYTYQEEDMDEPVTMPAVIGHTEEGKEYWAYTMPASDVYLEPIIEQDYYDIVFTDDGEPYDTARAMPGEFVEMLVPGQPFRTIVDAESDIEGFEYNYDTGYMSFMMPAENVEIVVTFEDIDYSDDVRISIKQNEVVVVALDNLLVMPGTVNITYYYWEEVFGIWTLSEGTLEPYAYAGDKIVGSFDIDFSDVEETIIYVQVDYVSGNGLVTAESPLTQYTA